MEREKYQDPLVWLVSKGADRISERQMLVATFVMTLLGFLGALAF